VSIRIIDIDLVDDGPVRIDEEVEPTPFDSPDSDPVEVLSARVRGEASRGERGVDLEAALNAHVRLQCSRCLEPVDVDLDSEFSLTVVASDVEPPLGEEAEMDLGAAELFVAPDGRALLADIAAEQVALNLPLKPICRPDCRGLCPTCGANRNLLECGCAEREIDPRLAPLLDLKKKRSERS